MDLGVDDEYVDVCNEMTNTKFSIFVVIFRLEL